jgi:hypothetical protein
MNKSYLAKVGKGEWKSRKRRMEMKVNVMAQLILLDALVSIREMGGYL